MSFGEPKTMLEDDFAPHYQAWKADPNPKTSSALLEAVHPVIRSALRTFGGVGGPQSPTLKSKAKLIVLDALPKYDPTKSKLRTHLMVNLQSLQRHTAEQNQIINVPERVRLDSLRVYQAHNELSDRLGRDPSDAELSEHTGLSAKRLHHIRKSKKSFAEGQMEGVNDEGETSQADVAVNNPWDEHNAQHAATMYLYGDLDPKDQAVMEHTLGLHGKPILAKSDIAKRLGITPGAVSHRAARIQQQIDAVKESGLF